MNLKINVKRDFDDKVMKKHIKDFNTLYGLKKGKNEIEDILNSAEERCYLNEVGQTVDMNGNPITNQSAAYLCVRLDGAETIDKQQVYAWMHKNKKRKFTNLTFGTKEIFDAFIAKNNSCSVGCLLFETGNQKDAFLKDLYETIKKDTIKNMDELHDYIENKIEITELANQGKIETGLFTKSCNKIIIEGELQKDKKLFKVKKISKVKKPKLKIVAKIVLIFAMLFATNLIFAQTIERDIWYEITSDTIPYTAAVVPHTSGMMITIYYYNGAISVKDTIEYNGRTYTVNEIADNAFYMCANVTHVTLPNTIKKIGRQAFCGSGITSIVIPDSVSIIGSIAFDGLNLSSLTLGKSVKNIGYRAFYNSVVDLVNYTGNIQQWCNIKFYSIQSNPINYSKKLYINNQPLTNLIIPNSVDTINKVAFINDTCIKTITIGSSVNYIGDSAFFGCSNIDTITFLGQNPPSFGSRWRTNVPSSVIINIPCGRYPWYHSALSTSILIESPFYDYTVMSEDTLKGAAFILSPATCSNQQAVIYSIANSGYTFSHWSDGNTQNPRTLTITQDTALIAYFNSITQPSQWYNISVSSEDTTKGFAHILSQPTQNNPQAVIIATANNGYSFSHWSDGNTQNPRTLTVTHDTSLIAYYDATSQPLTFNISVASEDTNKGSAYVLFNPTQDNPQAIIIATPHHGYTFSRWSDGNTQNPRSITVTQDTILIAFFTSNQGIIEAESASITLYPNPASETVTITGIGNEVNILVINALGKVVRRLDNVGGTLTFSVGDLPKGIYFVRVGNAVMKLVVE